MAVADADDAFHAALRARFGLLPRANAAPVADGLAYIGREYRVYAYMKIGFAARFYATLHDRWDPLALARALEIAGLAESYDVGRMKRAYQRALVLAFALAAMPHVLVVENAEEFDEPGARALLENAVRDVPASVVTYGFDAAIDRDWYGDVIAASDAVLAGGPTLPTPPPSNAPPDVTPPNVISPNVTSPNVASSNAASFNVASSNVACSDVACSDVACSDVASSTVASSAAAASTVASLNVERSGIAAPAAQPPAVPSP